MKQALKILYKTHKKTIIIPKLISLSSIGHSPRLDLYSLISSRPVNLPYFLWDNTKTEMRQSLVGRCILTGIFEGLDKIYHPSSCTVYAIVI